MLKKYWIGSRIIDGNFNTIGTTEGVYEIDFENPDSTQYVKDSILKRFSEQAPNWHPVRNKMNSIEFVCVVGLVDS